jgi:hypothetical protein
MSKNLGHDTTWHKVLVPQETLDPLKPLKEYTSRFPLLREKRIEPRAESHFSTGDCGRVRMRLLRRKSDDHFELVTFKTHDCPAYAILSHTWYNSEEVTYNDLVDGTGKNKAGYNKIHFCGERAAVDDIQYFWVDTCCTIQTHHRRQRSTKRVAYRYSANFFVLRESCIVVILWLLLK